MVEREEVARRALLASAQVKLALADGYTETIVRIADEMAAAYRRGGKVVLLGNGGSAADAQHLAGELVARLLRDRPALPALALTTNSSILTAEANDHGYERVFTRQVEALVAEVDVVIGLSTSGRSPSVIRAVEAAKAKGARTIGLSGGSGGELAEIADVCLVVPHSNSQRIQEAHITIGHALCDLVERDLFGEEEVQ
jgi:D-sedoheptulose 7-phosphate isomerase